MTLLSLHHWTDWRAGISEMRRLAPRGLVLTYVPELHASYWLLRDYLRRSLYLRERDLLELRTLRSKSPGTASMACFRSTSVDPLPTLIRKSVRVVRAWLRSTSGLSIAR